MTVHERLEAERLMSARDRAVLTLLELRTADGHWAGELSSSALSTATAVTALALVQRHRCSGDRHEFDPTLDAGLRWLASHQNPDGGWGDTVRSLSNISTTTLCWAAFGAVGRDKDFLETVRKAEQWLTERAGGVQPDRLGPAIIARYGKDRTFSVPILTLCALAGRLGEGRAAWRHVIPLPFELAAFPHRFFAALRLPVVSYALPALIAIGQARHCHAPSANPLVRTVRNAARRRTLKVLESIQPTNGGFLEATPLTSFVTMSLAGSGLAEHPVTQRGMNFLLSSQRSDGSWPIDTNLATWVTTLAVNALGSRNNIPPAGGLPSEAALSQKDRITIRDWLLKQQYRKVHPYTQAAPGGWAWTDLPGGVPDADDTAGALLALCQLGEVTDETRKAAMAGLEWLLNLQNRDGGIPTFCRGWGALPFDQSSADITAHAIRAWLAWEGAVPERLRTRIHDSLLKALFFLLRVHRPGGGWRPLWFGNQHLPEDENRTYGTARVVMALTEANAFARTAQGELVLSPVLSKLQQMRCASEKWLLQVQKNDGSWSGGCGGVSSVEETALATEALTALAQDQAENSNTCNRLLWAAHRGARWLVERVEAGDWTEPSPIGFYFAKLWYYEKLYPVIFTVGALRRLADMAESDPARQIPDAMRRDDRP